MQQTQSQVISTVAQPQSPTPDIVVLDDQLLSQVAGGWMGPGSGWSDLTAGPGSGW